MILSNVVSRFKISSPVDLAAINKAFQDSSVFEEAVFRKLVIVLKVAEPKCSYLIYKTGTVICTGGKSLEHAENSDDFIVKRLEQKGLHYKVLEKARVVNIVASDDLHHEVNLDSLVSASQKAEYEPEIFPGVIYKDPSGNNPGATILVFNSGKIVCLGGKTMSELKNMVKDFKVQLEEIMSQ
jgi:transcription initiation factor TFIID TATA-box-binding protein